ncbi:MAG: sigma-70 family RNA polymerase sigma factor [Candidatus Latescibacterota bacterium]
MAERIAPTDVQLDPPSDLELVQRLRAGEPGAFAALLGTYHCVAYDLAYKLLGDGRDAEEVVQDAFVKIHRALDGFRGEASLKTWILRIVMRLSLNRRRDRARSAWRRLGLHRREEPAPVELSPAHGLTPEAHCIARETRQEVLELIDKLPEPLRQTLILNTFEALSYEEIARVLDVPVGTVSSRIHSARRRLMRGLQERGLL